MRAKSSLALWLDSRLTLSLASLEAENYIGGCHNYGHNDLAEK